MGKLIVAAALALVAGIFIGGVAPRAELARTRRELEAAQKEAARGGGAGALPFALGLGGLAAAQREARERAASAPPPRFQPVPEHPAPGGERQSATEGDRPDGGGNPFGGPEALAAAKAAAALRAAQYREAFFQEARLSPEGQAAVTAVVADMNRELGQAAQQLMGQLENRSKLRPRDMADVGVKVLDIYRRADDRFKAGLDGPGREAAEKTQFNLLTQFDLGVMEGLAARLGGMDRSGAGSLP